MTKQKGICAECEVEYEYDYNKQYPRKYCMVCSAKKKQEWNDNVDKTPEVGDKIHAHGMAMGKPEVFEAEDPKPEVFEAEDPKPEVVRLGLTTIEEIQAKSKAERFTHNPKRGQFDKDPVGLAVDIFCVLRAQTDEEVEVTMSTATDLVKQAQKELS